MINDDVMDHRLRLHAMVCFAVAPLGRVAFAALLAVVCVTGGAGCNRGLPAVRPPSIDIDAAAEGAMAEFDENGDGTLAKDEACAGIANAWDRYDLDEDGSVSVDELKERFRGWSEGNTGLMNLRAQVTYRRKPLTRARIEMIPYEFLGSNVLSSQGKTDRYGYSFLAIPKDSLPKSQQGTHGMQVGLYRVSITHPEIDIPERYNTSTELTVDLSPAEANTGVRFDLK